MFNLYLQKGKPLEIIPVKLQNNPVIFGYEIVNI